MRGIKETSQLNWEIQDLPPGLFPPSPCLSICTSVHTSAYLPSPLSAHTHLPPYHLLLVEIPIRSALDAPSIFISCALFFSLTKRNTKWFY